MHRLLFLVVGLFFLLPSMADAASISRPVNGLGLVGYWSFNEGTSTNAGDYSGYGNAAIASTTWIAGKRGTALSFNRSTDYAYMPTFNQTLLPATFVAWVKVPSSVTLSSCRGAVFSRNTAVSGMNIGACSASTRLGYHWNNAANTYGWVTGPLIPRDEWFLAVLVVESDQATMYAISEDGVESAVNAVAHTSSVIDGLNVGRDPSQSRYFGGQIDEVRIYNRALAQSELESIYRSGGYARINASRTAVTNGLVAWWTMDGTDMAYNIGDKSGNGNHAYLINMATSTAQIPGKIGSALRFDGGDDYAFANDSDSLDTPDGLTVSAWVYDSNDGTQNHTLNKDDGSSNRNWIIRRQSDTTGNYHLWNSAGTLRQFVPANSWKINEWFHIVYTVSVSGSTITLQVFINGVSVGTDSFSGTAIRTGTAPVMMSKNTVAGTSEKAQRLDDVRIYNRALTAAEAKQIYNEGAGTKVNVSTTNDTSLDQGLISYWSFNGPDVSDYVYDRIGGNNGYFVGTATSTAKAIGKVGQAFNFNGSSDSIEIAHNANQLPTDGLSFSVWMKADSHGGNSRGRLIDKSTGTQAQGGFTLFTTNSGGDGQIGFAINNSSAIQSGSGSYALGQWVHVAATATAAGASIIYINGVQTTSGNTAALSGLTTTNALSIGKRSAASDRYFDGILDEVRMYNRVLTAAEVKQLYNAGR